MRVTPVDGSLRCRLVNFMFASCRNDIAYLAQASLLLRRPTSSAVNPICKTHRHAFSAPGLSPTFARYAPSLLRRCSHHSACKGARPSASHGDVLLSHPNVTRCNSFRAKDTRSHEQCGLRSGRIRPRSVAPSSRCSARARGDGVGGPGINTKLSF